MPATVMWMLKLMASLFLLLCLIIFRYKKTRKNRRKREKITCIEEQNRKEKKIKIGTKKKIKIGTKTHQCIRKNKEV